MKRLGLKESLEEYSKRTRLSGSTARMNWRIQGLLLLGVPSQEIYPELVTQSPLRIAPNIPIPTRPADYEFYENDSYSH